VLPLSSAGAGPNNIFAGLVPGHDAETPPVTRRPHAHKPADDVVAPRRSSNPFDEKRGESGVASGASAHAKSPFAFNAFDERSWQHDAKGHNVDLTF
jgi:hypothetical protein